MMEIVITERELQIVTELSIGEKCKEIAAKMDVSIRTMEDLISGVMKKVGAKSQAHLVAIFIREEIIK